MAWFDVISHARLFFKKIFTDQPRNPWHMLAEPLGSAEPRLKITGLEATCTYGKFTPTTPTRLNQLQNWVASIGVNWPLCKQNRNLLKTKTKNQRPDRDQDRLTWQTFITLSIISRLHDRANVEQMYSKYTL